MKTNKLFTLLFLTSLLLSTLAYAQNQNKIGFLEKPVPIASVNDIEGFFGDRIALNRDVYLKDFPIDEYVDFVVSRQHTEWNWTKAEQHGKWVESAYLSAIQSGDEELLAKAKAVLKRIIDSQEEEGYVGATAKSFRTPERPVRGMDAYELYFVFHAFLTVYEETNNQEALTAAEKLADYYLKYFGPGKLEFWPSDLRYPENKGKEVKGTSEFAGHSVHYSWEGTLLCDPIARLYELTGKKKYLDWSQWLVNNIDKWSGWDAFSRLDSVADGTLGVDKLQPYVHSHTFHMNFMGFLRLYQITGDKSLLRKVAGAWDDIRERQMFITGGVSVGEHYEYDYVKPLSGNVVETCATMSWMQLTQLLLQLTGDTKYGDAIERLMINHVFAAQDCQGGVCRYHTAPNGDKPSGHDGFFHGPDCCTASGHRIISLLPTFLYAEKGGEFFINQYIPSSYAGDQFSFDVAGNYPETENFSINFTAGKNVHKTINLRIPSWCSSPKVSVNGESVVNVTSGSYLTLKGKWSQGDKIDISFPMETQWVKRENHSDYVTSLLPGGEIMYKEEPTDKTPYAFIRGPIVYSLDMVWNKQIHNDDVDIDGDIRIDTTVEPIQIDKPYENILGPVYKTKALYKGSETDVVLTPFTNIGQWYRPDEPKPVREADAFTYGIWLFNEGTK
ncbi:beta-L-arabinofuranosidase domain-containing protein [Flagellimonas iocasae]|uniref:Beta-L-arabinofuranosidase domain-containing protein n=1 Tax=Flagellimonas iocasae TaxID=2055905 RepID=A0ABW4XYB0_9FLAO